jgi:hypothetical protein
VDQPDRFGLATELLGPLPVINAFCARLGLAALLESYLPREGAVRGRSAFRSRPAARAVAGLRLVRVRRR